MSASPTEALALDEALARLTGEARDRAWPNLRPVPAATLILVDPAGPVPRVLMGRRNPALKFMPNRFVFPGGALDAADRGIACALPLADNTRARLVARVPRAARDLPERLALAAIRETYEETGLLLGARGPWGGAAPAAWQAFARQGIVPDLGRLDFVARAITPPRRPRRFDTRFFLAPRAAVAGEEPGFVGPDKELVELAWLRIDEAHTLPMPAITAVILQEAAHHLAGGREGVPDYREIRGKFARSIL